MPEFIIATKEDTILYPDTDGKPIAENTIQYEWITLIRGNLDIIFSKREDVFPHVQSNPIGRWPDALRRGRDARRRRPFHRVGPEAGPRRGDGPDRQGRDRHHPLLPCPGGAGSQK